jgi:hypothetical protein
MEEYADYDQRVRPYRSSPGSAAAAFMIVLLLGLLILFAVMAMAANTSDVNGVGAAAPSVITTSEATGADETIAFQALLSQAQTDQQAARQEAVNLQTRLQASQTELQQTRDRLSQAETRANDLQTQVTALQQQIEQERWWLPLAVGLLALIVLVAVLRSVTVRQSNKQLVVERERRIQWEMTRMRVMYNDALEKAQQQLDLMRHQLAQVRGAASRQPPRNRTITNE